MSNQLAITEDERVSNLIYGVGFNSGGLYKTRVDRKITGVYKLWRNMLERCYSPKFHERQPAYIGCNVDSKWHDFQVFAEWIGKQKYNGCGYQLDKDILITGNKIYSAESCCFVPQEINSLFTDCASARGALPKGVCFYKRDGNYKASINLNRKRKHLGYFKCPDEAYQAYVVAKEAYVKEVANKWRGRIDERVYEALMHWKVTE